MWHSRGYWSYKGQSCGHRDLTLKAPQRTQVSESGRKFRQNLPPAGKYDTDLQQNFLSEVSESCLVLSDSLGPHGLYNPRNSPPQSTGVGSLSLLQGIFPTQGSNPGLPHCGSIPYQLSHKGSPRLPASSIKLSSLLPNTYLSVQ